MPRCVRSWTILLSTVLAIAAERVDPELQMKIRDEAMFRSRILRTLHYLTDVHGPRLTGSPSCKAAGEWAIAEMRSWGLENAHLKPWDFGHAGWSNDRLTAHIVSPVKDPLVCEVVAWTPGTHGVATARATHVVPPERPKPDELERYLDGIRDQVRGKIVLVGRHQIVPVTLEPPPLRRDERQLRAQYDPRNPNAGQFGARSRRGGGSDPSRMTAAQVTERLDTHLRASGAVVKVIDAGRDHGQIRAFSNRTYDPSRTVPTVVMRNEDYGRLVRLLAAGTAVELEFEIVNRVHPDGRTAYNAIAEIRGSDRKEEVVMLGAHLDSWHAATGATDNAIGCAVMMEAVRILKAVGARPRRTIRIALWTGEEQGLLGSQAYVREHFGSFENPKPAFHTFGGYLNIDSGTGRARGASVFGPPEAGDILSGILSELEDLGVVGAVATRSRRLGGTDSTSFNQAGLPGIGFGQDPIEYGTYTWHTNLDTYERIVEEDAKASAIVIASAVYALATRDGMLPRFDRESMPPPPPSGPAPQPTQPTP